MTIGDTKWTSVITWGFCALGLSVGTLDLGFCATVDQTAVAPSGIRRLIGLREQSPPSVNPPGKSLSEIDRILVDIAAAETQSGPKKSTSHSIHRLIGLRPMVEKPEIDSETSDLDLHDKTRGNAERLSEAHGSAGTDHPDHQSGNFGEQDQVQVRTSGGINKNENTVLTVSQQSENPEFLPPAPDTPSSFARDGKKTCRMESIEPDLKQVRIQSGREFRSRLDKDGKVLSTPENTARLNYFRQIPSLYQTSQPWNLRLPNRYTYPIQYRPLYFEQARKERCGEGLGCWSTAASAGAFFGQTLLLPYQVLARCPSTMVSPLGDCPTWSSYEFGVTIPRPFEGLQDCE